ncbi:MAG TPA: MFS transporter, partial [Rugosimonospora sp.]|nr:MFS transporter [Rugosimonospora sp.]
NVIEVFFIRGTLHGSATLFGLIGAAWMAGMVPGAWLLARRRLSDPALAVAMLGLVGAITVAGLAAAAMPRAEWLLPLWVLGGACNGGVNVAITVQLGRRVPEEARGRAFAIFAGTVQGGNAIGYLLGGVLLGVASPRLLFAAAEATGLLVVLALALPVVRAARREREPAHSNRARTVGEHERAPAAEGGAHPVPELPADLLGADALGRAAGS